MQDDAPLIAPLAATEDSAALILHPTLATKVNFASAQNGVAVIKRLEIENCGAEPAEGIRLTLSASPAIFREKTWVIDRIAAGAILQLGDLETALDTALLSGLDEAEIGQLEFRLIGEGRRGCHLPPPDRDAGPR